MNDKLSELVSLDLLTLREHTERAGDRFDERQHRERLLTSLAVSQLCEVRRAGRLVAYAMLKPEPEPEPEPDSGNVAEHCWFVSGFNTHPQFRHAAVMLELFTQVTDLIQRQHITALRSHVYKTNHLSMSFHQRLGFHVTRENDKGVEFYVTVAQLSGTWAIARTAKSLGLIAC